MNGQYWFRNAAMVSWRPPAEALIIPRLNGMQLTGRDRGHLVDARGAALHAAHGGRAAVSCNA